MALLLAIASPAAASVAPAGTVDSGRYPNLFAQGDPAHDARAIDAKLDSYWQALFAGDADQRVYYPAPATRDGPSGYILDSGNGDVRTEGMSYGMMIAVQMDRKSVFDALWTWAHTHMRYASGPRAGYFRWRCAPTGCVDDAVPASDGEEYFATALFFAAHRWGSGRGIRDYAGQANAILDTMLHKQDMGGTVDGTTAMFDRATHQVVFVPQGASAHFTDPSYHLPAFYELWARWARGWHRHRAADRAFWRDAARASRRLFARAADARTGLTPDYAGFDGHPVADGDHADFRSDAYRTAINWAVDQRWWARDPGAGARTDRLLAFFRGQGMDRYGSAYRLDGTRLSADRSAALIAANGAAALAADPVPARPFVAALWRLDPPRGRWRYYDGMLQFMTVLHVSGRFRAW